MDRVLSIQFIRKILTRPNGPFVISLPGLKDIRKNNAEYIQKRIPAASNMNPAALAGKTLSHFRLKNPG